MDREKVVELFGVSPEQIPDLLGLWGDTSDNVPGAPGIGEKGARDLIQRFGTIESLLDRTGEVTNAKHRTSLVDNRDQLLAQKDLFAVLHQRRTMLGIRHFAGAIEQRINGAEPRNQIAGAFFPDPGGARDVI